MSTAYTLVTADRDGYNLKLHRKKAYCETGGHFIHSFFAIGHLFALRIVFQRPFQTWWSTQSSHADVHTFIHYFMSLTSLKFTSFLFLSSYKVVVNCLRAWLISYFHFCLCTGDTLLGDKKGSWQKDEPTHDNTNLLKAEKIPVAKKCESIFDAIKAVASFPFRLFRSL